MSRAASAAAPALARFRSAFPALRRFAWLDTAAVPPCATPIVTALHGAIAGWRDGTFDWREWESAADETRGLVARLIGAEPSEVALLGSLAEAAGTVAASLPRGRVVVGECEFRSNLFPWLALERLGHEIDVLRGPHPVSTERLICATDERVALVAISEVQSGDGFRIDARAVAARCRQVGARLFLNLTQSAGVLRTDVRTVGADYAAAHGYKWLLAPRGAAWLYVRPELVDEMHPLAANWKSAPDPYRQLYGGPLELAASTSRLDASLAWLPWVGACAALQLIHDTGPDAIESQALELAGEFRTRAARSGWRVGATDLPSHLTAVVGGDPHAIALRLLAAGVRTSVRSPGVRMGFHAFNSFDDVERALAALARHRSD